MLILLLNLLLMMLLNLSTVLLVSKKVISLLNRSVMIYWKGSCNIPVCFILGWMQRWQVKATGLMLNHSPFFTIYALTTQIKYFNHKRMFLTELVASSHILLVLVPKFKLAKFILQDSPKQRSYSAQSLYLCKIIQTFDNLTSQMSLLMSNVIYQLLIILHILVA